jgi:hypothetical protein
MDIEWIGFGEIRIDGEKREKDVVIDSGEIRKRKKKLSKPYRDRYGHTPLSIDEDIPWGGDRLIVGTGASGALPVMSEVEEEATRRAVELLPMPTPDACRLLAELPAGDVHAILHLTC